MQQSSNSVFVPTGDRALLGTENRLIPTATQMVIKARTPLRIDQDSRQSFSKDSVRMQKLQVHHTNKSVEHEVKQGGAKSKDNQGQYGTNSNSSVTQNVKE